MPRRGAAQLSSASSVCFLDVWRSSTNRRLILAFLGRSAASMARVNRRLRDDLNASAIWQRCFFSTFFAPSEAAVMIAALKGSSSGTSAAPTGPASAAGAAGAALAPRSRRRVLAEALRSRPCVRAATAPGGAMPPHLRVALQAWEAGSDHPPPHGGMVPPVARFARHQAQIAKMMLRMRSAAARGSPPDLDHLVETARALSPVLPAILEQPAWRLGMWDDEIVPTVNLVRALAACSNRINARFLLELREEFVARLDFMATQAVRSAAARNAVGPGELGIRAAWSRVLAPVWPALQAIHMEHCGHELSGLPDPELLEAAMATMVAGRDDVLVQVEKWLETAPCWTRAEASCGDHWAVQKALASWKGQNPTPLRLDWADASLVPGPARERDSALQACIEVFRAAPGGRHHLHERPVSRQGVHMTLNPHWAAAAKPREPPLPFRALGAAVMASVRAHRSTLGLTIELSDWAMGDEARDMIRMTWMVVAAAVLCLIAAPYVAWQKWADLCTLRVLEAFPEGLTPAAAAAWLCPLGAAVDRWKLALGFTCDLLQPTSPPTLAGNVPNLTLDPRVLSLPLCGNNTGFQSRAAARLAFESDLRWIPMLAFVLAALLVVAIVARAWAAASAWAQGQPSRLPVFLLLLLEMTVRPLSSLPINVRIAAGPPKPQPLALQWEAASLAIAAAMAQGQYYDDRGVCAALAFAVAVVSMVLALVVLPRRAVQRRFLDAERLPLTVADCLAAIQSLGLALHAVVFACWSGYLLECWGSTWLGVGRSPRDATLVFEMACGSVWQPMMIVAIVIWGAGQFLRLCLEGEEPGGGHNPVLWQATGILGVFVALLAFTWFYPIGARSMGMFLRICHVLVLSLSFLLVLAMRAAAHQATVRNPDRLLRHLELPTGTRGSVTAAVAQDALRIVRTRARRHPRRPCPSACGGC